MPGGRPSRKLIAIREKSGSISYRWVSAGYKAPTPIKRENTKWASCEIGKKTEVQEPRFVQVGLTSTGMATFSPAIIKPVIVSFNEPCPLGKPRKKKKGT
jgi:hypothetical protein